MSIDKKAFGLSDSLISAVSEALKGGQVKIDKNHNGKIDGQDFKMLRKEENIDEKSVSKAQQHAAGAALATQRGEYDGGKKGGAINRMASMKTSELRKFAGTKTKELPTHKEEVEQVDEISLKTKIKAYAATREPDADYNRGDKVHSQGDRLRSKIVAKHGEKAGDHADRAAYGKPSTPATRSAEKSKSDPLTKATSSTNKMRITKSGVANKQDQKSNAAVIKSRIGKHGKSNLPEDIEQVDELSKQTMGSYIKKASHDVATKSAATGRYADRANAVKDQMKKGDYSNYQQGKKDDATADKMFNKSWKRREGIAKATDKLTKEDVQVDEVLDTNIKKFAYLMKAKRSIKKSDPNDIKQANDIANRTIGAKRLMNKLTKKKVSEDVEQVDELSTDTYHSAAKKAAKRAMGDAQGRSGPIFKKYAGMANKFRDKGMSQEKKEKAAKDAKSAKMKAYRADRDKHMEEATDPRDSRPETWRPNNTGYAWDRLSTRMKSDPKDSKARKAGKQSGLKHSIKSALGKHGPKGKLPEETDPGFAEAAENPMAKQLADKKAAIQKTIAQKKMQVMQQKAQKTISSMKEGKGCSCMEGKKSMTCEVHGDKAKGMKGGKEPILMNPPLRD